MTIHDAKALIGLCIDEGLKQGILKNKGEFEELFDYLDKCFSDTDKMINGSSEIPKDLEEAAEKHSTDYDSTIWYVLESSNQKTIWKRELKETFIAGAKWQKELMMKEAVELELKDGENVNYPSDWSESKMVALYFYTAPTFKPGDKVRIIIVKED